MFMFMYAYEMYARAPAEVSLLTTRGVPRGVPTYYQACGGGTMVWDYPEALEVIRSEQAAGCVAAVLCGHAACYSKCRAPSCYPSLLPHPATPACWGGFSREALL